MLVNDVVAEPQDDLIDEFDLDIRISVLPDTADISAGFSTWQSCQSCTISCKHPPVCR